MNPIDYIYTTIPKAERRPERFKSVACIVLCLSLIVIGLFMPRSAKIDIILLFPFAILPILACLIYLYKFLFPKKIKEWINKD